MTELIINIIVESMSTQCDELSNEFLLLVFLIDYHKDNKAIALTDQ